MTPELAYFLKINIAIALFYAFYRLFFYRDTFFQWRRTALLCFLVISPLYPVLNIQEWIRSHEPMVAMVDLYATIVLPEIEITPEVRAADWQSIILSTVNIIYWSGVTLLLVRFFAQLASILRLRLRCRKDQIEGIPVYLLNKESGPFSFFHWIFIYPQAHPQNELSEILTHEGTHARQRHSIDVIISELMCIACWFNPFMWLMKREVRNNLEYMADNRVLEAGHDSKSYQYHLLGIKHTSLAAANFYNNFSVLPLKKRIKMLNRKRTHNIMVGKYLMFIPVAALLLLFSNCANKKADKVQSDTEKADTIELTAEPEKTAEPQVDITITETKGDSIYSVVETMPDFPGGQKELLSFLSRNIKYPTKAIESKIQGRVIVQFVVNKDGSISNAKVVRSVDPDLDKEALRVINSMPKWKPGMQKGEPVSVKYTVPIVFRNQQN